MLLSQGARFVLDRISSSGRRAFVVGGSVRDFYMGKTPSDYDVTTDALPEEIKEIFSDLKSFDQGLKHGTVSVLIDGEVIEITTHRRDGAYEDHRRPDSVIFTKVLEEDLARRDFTINSMAYSTDEGLVDIFGGIADIERGLIRCTGDAEVRFEEDALRILRALRFASCCDFEIEESTKKAIFKKAHLLSFVSRERISDEIVKFTGGKGASRILFEYREIFERIFDKINLEGTFPFEKVDERALKLLLLFYHSSDISRYISSLSIPKTDRAFLKKLIPHLKNALPTDKLGIRKLISTEEEEVVRALLKIKSAVGETDGETLALFEKLFAEVDFVLFSDLALKGDDLNGIIKEKKDIGTTLHLLHERVIEGKVENEKKALLEYLSKL